MISHSWFHASEKNELSYNMHASFTLHCRNMHFRSKKGQHNSPGWDLQKKKIVWLIKAWGQYAFLYWNTLYHIRASIPHSAWTEIQFLHMRHNGTSASLQKVTQSAKFYKAASKGYFTSTFIKPFIQPHLWNLHQMNSQPHIKKGSMLIPKGTTPHSSIINCRLMILLFTSGVAYPALEWLK